MITDQVTATRAVQRSEENDLCAVKRMTVIVKSNTSGPLNMREVYPRIKAENDYSTQVALRGFSDDEVRQVKSLLSRMSRNVSDSWDFVKQGGHREY